MRTGLTTVATGSSGNAYILEFRGEKILLDCGVSWKELRQMLDGSVRDVKACLVTHGHQDHMKSASAVEKAGVPVYMPFRRGGFFRTVSAGGFRISAIEGCHDAPCFCYRIELPAGEVFLYATDTSRFPPVSGVDYALIECNYDMMTLIANANAGIVSGSLAGRICRSHASFDVAANFVACHRKSLKTVVLCHYSDDNIEIESIFERFVSRFPGIRFEIARPGLWTEL